MEHRDTARHIEPRLSSVTWIKVKRLSHSLTKRFVGVSKNHYIRIFTNDPFLDSRSRIWQFDDVMHKKFSIFERKNFGLFEF